MSEPRFKTLDSARLWNPAVHAFLTMVDTGRLSRGDAIEQLALHLANDFAILMDEHQRVLAESPPSPAAFERAREMLKTPDFEDTPCSDGGSHDVVAEECCDDHGALIFCMKCGDDLDHYWERVHTARAVVQLLARLLSGEDR